METHDSHPRPDVDEENTHGGHTYGFHLGHQELLLFPALDVSTRGEMAWACLAVFLIALLYEGLRLFVSWLQLYVNSVNKPLQRSPHSTLFLGVLHTASYLLHLFTGYCLMVVFMMLNVWLCLALMLGAGAGFVTFHFLPVRSRLFQCLGKGDKQSHGPDGGEPAVITSPYKPMEGYDMTNSGGHKLTPEN